MTKDPVQSNPPDDPLDPLVEEAVCQLLHLHSGEETEQDWAAYQNWKDASEAHLVAAEHAEAIWNQIGPASSQKSRKVPAIVVAALGLAGLAFALGVFGEPRSLFADYRTAVGEHRAVTLRDGSQIEIDSGTSFDVGADSRSIELYAGQIFLSVQSNPAQPFSVKAADGTVRTLGTKFGVRRDADAVTAFVTENAVRISYDGDPRQSVDVQAGQVARYSPTDGLQPARAADIRALTAWQRGELSFNDQPLSKVVSELERYRSGKILLIGDNVKRLPVTGVFDAQDPDGALASLSLALPVSIRTFAGVTVIYSDSREGSRPEKM